MNLGTKPQTEIMPTAASPSKPKIRYPSFNLDDEKMEEFMDAHPKEFNDTSEAKVKVRVGGLRRDEYGKSIRFEVLEMEPTKDEHVPGMQKFEKLFPGCVKANTYRMK